MKPEIKKLLMDADMRELAKRTLSKVDALTEAEFAELPIYAADEV